MKDKWKVIALVMTAIVLIETCTFVYFFMVGSQMVANEETCAYDICGKYDSYTYDEYTNTCYCWEGNEIAIEKQM